MILVSLALTTAAAFAGAAIYVSCVEHPARLTLDDAAMLAQWKPAYERGAIMQGALALVCAALGFAAYALERNTAAAIGAALILANWPFTLVAIMPTNNRMKASAAADAQTRPLMLRWGRLHAVRTTLGLAATAVFLFALTR